MPQNTNIIVKARDVRGSFLHIFEPRARPTKPGEKPKKPKYEASLLLHKVRNASTIAEIKAAFSALAKEKGWPDPAKMPKFYKSICLSEAADKVQQDGSPYEGYDSDHLVLAVRGVRKPTVFDPADGSPLAVDDRGIYYSGCYLHANVDIYAYTDPKDSSIGKHLCCSPRTFIFARSGERLGGGDGGAPKDFADEFGDVKLGGNADEESPL